MLYGVYIRPDHHNDPTVHGTHRTSAHSERISITSFNYYDKTFLFSVYMGFYVHAQQKLLKNMNIGMLQLESVF